MAGTEEMDLHSPTRSTDLGLKSYLRDYGWNPLKVNIQAGIKTVTECYRFADLAAVSTQRTVLGIVCI